MPSQFDPIRRSLIASSVAGEPAPPLVPPVSRKRIVSSSRLGRCSAAATCSRAMRSRQSAANSWGQRADSSGRRPSGFVAPIPTARHLDVQVSVLPLAYDAELVQRIVQGCYRDAPSLLGADEAFQISYVSNSAGYIVRWHQKRGSEPISFTFGLATVLWRTVLVHHRCPSSCAASNRLRSVDLKVFRNTNGSSSRQHEKASTFVVYSQREDPNAPSTPAA